jgi:hypothetical protein
MKTKIIRRVLSPFKHQNNKLMDNLTENSVFTPADKRKRIKNIFSAGRNNNKIAKKLTKREQIAII